MAQRARKRLPCLGEAMRLSPFLPLVTKPASRRPPNSDKPGRRGSPDPFSLRFTISDRPRLSSLRPVFFIPLTLQQKAGFPCSLAITAFKLGSAAARFGNQPRAPFVEGLTRFPLARAGYLANAMRVAVFDLDACGPRHLPGPSVTGLWKRKRLRRYYFTGSFRPWLLDPERPFFPKGSVARNYLLDSSALLAQRTLACLFILSATFSAQGFALDS